jgi:SAM-dependent methyltransferase
MTVTEIETMRAQYGRLCTEAYDLDKPQAPPEALAFYVAQIREHGVDGPVLEAMCGSGRFLAPLVEAGFEVDGVDASPDMLEACSWRCREDGVRTHLYEQWLHELDLPRQYGFVLVAAGSFGLVIDDDEVRDALLRLRAHMLPGAAMLVEVEAPRERRGDGLWRGRWWNRADGGTITARQLTNYDAATQIETGLGCYELWAERKLVDSELDRWVCRFWDADAFAACLREAGFESVEPVNGLPFMTTFLARAPRA